MRTHEFTLRVETPDDYRAPTADIIRDGLYQAFGDVDSKIIFAVEEADRA